MAVLQIDLTSQVKGMLPIANGGTGGSTGFLPDPTGHAGEFLMTDGTTAMWMPVSGGSSPGMEDAVIQVDGGSF